MLDFIITLCARAGNNREIYKAIEPSMNEIRKTSRVALNSPSGSSRRKNDYCNVVWGELDSNPNPKEITAGATNFLYLLLPISEELLGYMKVQ